MNDLPTPTYRSASGLASLIALLGVAGVAVLLSSVALAVGGPLLDLPGLQLDVRVWAVGSALLGGGAWLVLLAVLLRKSAAGSVAGPALPAAPGAAPAPLFVHANSHAAAQLHVLAQAVPQGVALSRERRFAWANGLFCEQLGWAPSELLGRSPYELFSSVNADDSLGAALRTAFAAGQAYDGVLQFRRRDGSRFAGRLQARQVAPADPAAGTLWQLDDLTARPADTVALDTEADSVVDPTRGSAATRDPLTRLLNRPAFEAVLTAWLQQARPGQTACLLQVDLDGFKAYNAAAGRDAGDALLCAAADTLQAHVRAGDAVARLDGDAFALLLPGCVAAVAVQLGQRLRTELAGLALSPQGRPGSHASVGATVGVAEVDRRAAGSGGQAAANAAAWLARSHAAWYEAKYGGGGPVRLAAPQASVPVVVLPA